MDKPMLVLQPTFDEAADPIALLAALTPIGRDHPQIVRYGEACLVALETRHARIILEQDAPILLDLSESGATLRNGEPVGNGPVPINPGDVLKFGDALEFRVQPLQNPDPQVTRMLTQPQPVVLLLLTPLTEQGPDAVIAVTEFPFLIASSDGHFATYQATHPEPASFLSRRHAHIYLSDDVLLLEDLGSTNGTQHNGQALRQQAVPLTNGDQVRFGHKDFTFEVAVTVEQASEHVTQRAL
ncbi:MAG: FHA domain-containing protein, partial [Pseudomonadales bacterium]